MLHVNEMRTNMAAYSKPAIKVNVVQTAITLLPLHCAIKLKKLPSSEHLSTAVLAQVDKEFVSAALVPVTAAYIRGIIPQTLMMRW